MKPPKYEEAFRQPYKNGTFSSDIVRGNSPKKDSIYLRIEHIKPEKNVTLHFTPDEAECVAYLLGMANWLWMLSVLGRKQMEGAQIKSLPPRSNPKSVKGTTQ
jgi:hypothetical protein